MKPPPCGSALIHAEKERPFSFGALVRCREPKIVLAEVFNGFRTSIVKIPQCPTIHVFEQFFHGNVQITEYSDQ
jgi:hypothetical protein